MSENAAPNAIEIIKARIGRMRDIAEANPEDDPEELWMAKVFHLMEVQAILEGKYTCGIYDDFGPPEGMKPGDKRR